MFVRSTVGKRWQCIRCRQRMGLREKDLHMELFTLGSKGSTSVAFERQLEVCFEFRLVLLSSSFHQNGLSDCRICRGPADGKCSTFPSHGWQWRHKNLYSLNIGK